MKKLIVLFLFVIGLLLETAAGECAVVKIGQKITIYNFEDLGNSNYWGDKVKITKDTILPNDACAKSMGIPDEEWSVFSEKVNGIYDSRVGKLQKKNEEITKEKDDLRSDYNKLFAEKSRVDDLVNILEASIGILILVIIFIVFKLAHNKFQKKFKSAIM